MLKGRNQTMTNLIFTRDAAMRARRVAMAGECAHVSDMNDVQVTGKNKDNGVKERNDVACM